MRIIVVALCLALLPLVARAPSVDELLAFTPTGDALFDRYAVMVLDRERRHLALYDGFNEALIAHFQLEGLRGDPAKLQSEFARLFEAGGKAAFQGIYSHEEEMQELQTDLASPPLSELQALEPEFGADPRYWQLLSFAAESKHYFDGDAHFDSAFHPGVYTPLIEAYERGVVDAPTLLMLLPMYKVASDGYVPQQLEYQDQWRQRHAADVQAATDAGETPDEDYATYFTEAQLQQFNQQAKELVVRIGLSEQQLYDAAIQASPDWAQAYYTRASMYMRSGSFDNALSDFEAGNAAPTNCRMVTFPFSAIEADISAGRVPGNRLLPGFIALTNFIPWMDGVGGSYGRVGRMEKEQFLTLSAEKRLLLYSAITKQALRQGVANNPSNPWTQLIALERTLTDLQKDLGSRLDDRSAALLSEDVDKATALSKHMGELNKEWAEADSTMSYVTSFDEWPLTGNTLLQQLTPVFERFEIEAERGTAIFNSDIEPALLELQQFDLSSLTLKPQ